jgi:hypothetical protein
MPHKAIVIEVTADTLTAIEIAGSSGVPEINRWAKGLLPPEGLTAVWVREFWRQEKFSATRAVWLLPETLVQYKTLTFMVLPEEQLMAAVKLEMENCAGSDELWRVICIRSQNGQTLVRVAVVANRELTQSLDIFTQAGLEIIWSGFYSRGIQNFILFHRDPLVTELNRFAYLYLTAERSEYGVVTEDSIFYRREIPIGNRVLAGTDSVDVHADLLEELRLSFATSKTNGQQDSDTLWLFGDDEAALAGLQKVLTRAGLTVVLPAKTNFNGVLTQNMTPRLAPLIGLALDESGWNSVQNLRLYSLEQQKQQMIKRKCRWLLQWGCVAGFIFLGCWLLMQAQRLKSQTERQWLADQQTKLNQLRRVETLTQAELKKLTKLEQWSSAKAYELEFMLALQKRLPPGTLITDLTIEKGKVKNLAGTTPSVSLLLTELADDPRLKVLELKGNIMTTEDGREGFQLEERDIPKEKK